MQQALLIKMKAKQRDVECVTDLQENTNINCVTVCLSVLMMEQRCTFWLIFMLLIVQEMIWMSL